MMGIHVLPQLDNYWSSDDYLGVRGIMAVTSRSRFKKITQYFHINNTTAVARGERGYDPLHKIRPLLSATSNSFARRYRPGRDLSIDEAMVAFKGRSFMKQYMPAKPVKWGGGSRSGLLRRQTLAMYLAMRSTPEDEQSRPNMAWATMS